ncbi:IclR family transcriptional regulator [Phytoactinopolyspora limicola]|uniref:IclR family transcriptional regulator n=1 Tax=Phytoactinopolyspora limicola TaxID=2715536 RepID=UPI00140B427B|nr:IclR family transcriptional regulator [Phytoactinopolyspora limicola]
MSGSSKPTQGRSAKAPTDGPKVLEKALRVLDLFTRRDPEWPVSGIARELDLPFATAHRIVRTLESFGLLARTRDRRYRLGEGAISLGQRATASFDAIARLVPVLEWLWGKTDETTTITIFHRRPLGALCVRRIEGNYPLRLSLDVGTVSPLHAGASAKALLAHLGEETFTQVTAEPLTPHAAGTITDPATLHRDLETIRERGWAFDREELCDGAWGMATPALGLDDELVASIGFAAPVIRLTPELERLGREFIEEAGQQAAAALNPRTDH